MHWHLTEDVDGFLARTGDFLRSRPALHTSQLTRLEKLRTDEEKGTLFGQLEQDGEVTRDLLLPSVATPDRHRDLARAGRRARRAAGRPTTRCAA